MEPKIYSSITEVLKTIEDENPPNLLPLTDDDESYEWIDFGDSDGGRIMPSWNSRFYTPFLFRGQNKRHSPCFPSLYRPLGKVVKSPNEVTKDLQEEFLMYQIKWAEFGHSIEFHPSIAYSREIGLHINKIALAQHYGIPTDLLDLTQDPYVAAFFATCKCDNEGNWFPIDKGTGVIYKFDITVFSSVLDEEQYSHEEYFKKLELIGLQTLPRPGEQKAWTFQLNPSVDFERLPLKMYLFNQSENESIKIFEMFDNGKKLFPYDVASNLANRILKSSIIPESLAAEVFLSHGCDNQKLRDALNHYNEKFNQHFNLRIEDSEPIGLSEQEIKQAQKYLDLKKDRFLSNVGVRGVKITDTDALIKFANNV